MLTMNIHTCDGCGRLDGVILLCERLHTEEQERWLSQGVIFLSQVVCTGFNLMYTVFKLVKLYTLTLERNQAALLTIAKSRKRSKMYCIVIV